jgi:acyl-CoA thioester hydrolase
VIRTETSIRVRYVETDAMGFAHHASYLAWLEMARIEMLDQIGISYKEFEQAGYFIPVLGVSVKYRKPAFFDDILTIVCLVNESPTLRFHIDYEVFRGDKLLATASTDHAFINKEGRPVRPQEEFVARFKEVLAREQV